MQASHFSDRKLNSIEQYTDEVSLYLAQSASFCAVFSGNAKDEVQARHTLEQMLALAFNNATESLLNKKAVRVLILLFGVYKPRGLDCRCNFDRTFCCVSSFF